MSRGAGAEWGQGRRGWKGRRTRRSPRSRGLRSRGHAAAGRRPGCPGAAQGARPGRALGGGSPALGGRAWRPLRRRPRESQGAPAATLRLHRCRRPLPGQPPAPPAPRRDPPGPPPALPCARGPGPEPGGGAPLSSMGSSQLSEPTAGRRGRGERGRSCAGGRGGARRDQRGGARCLTGTRGLEREVDGRRRGAGCDCRAEGDSSTCRCACSCWGRGAPSFHLLFFSSSHLASDAERRAPRHIPPISFLPPKPRDSETTLSTKSLGRNCSLEVPITALALGVSPTSSYPSAHTQIQVAFLSRQTSHIACNQFPGDTHCSGFHIHPPASHANCPRTNNSHPRSHLPPAGPHSPEGCTGFLVEIPQATPRVCQSGD